MFEINRGRPLPTHAITRDLVHSGLMTSPEYHISEGIRYGFKDCCIKNYVNLTMLRIPPASFMFHVLGHDTNVEYVMCPLCYAEYDKANPDRPREAKVLVDPKTNKESGWGDKLKNLANELYGS